MSQPNTISPLLAELRRLSTAQDAVALMPAPLLDMSVGSMGVDPTASSAIVEMQEEIGVLIAHAPDADLVAAYLETGGEPGTLDADTLLTEIERRNLDI